MASLGSLLFYIPYNIYKGIKTGVQAYRKKYESAGYNLSATLLQYIFYPFYSLYRAAVATLELVSGYVLPWQAV